MVVKSRGKNRSDPYVQVFINGKKEREHVVIAERALGRPLPEDAEVHHLDENKKNNLPSNLVICPSREYHFLLHRRQKALDACGNADWLCCKLCKQYDDPNALVVRKSKTNRLDIYHQTCNRDIQRKKARAAGRRELPRISQEVKACIYDLLLSGESVATIAKKFGVNEVTVYRVRWSQNRVKP